MIHNSDINDLRYKFQKLEILVKLIKISNESRHSEACEDEMLLLKYLAQFLIKSLLVFLIRQRQKVYDVDLKSGAECEKRGSKHID